MKAIITFSILFIVFLFCRLLFGYYIEAVPAFEVLLTPLTWLTVVFGLFLLLFVVLKVIKAIKDIRSHKDD